MRNTTPDVDVSQLADITLAGTYTGLDARLQTVVCDWDTNGVRAEGTFCYLSFRDGKPTQDDFIKFVYHRIIPFCLPRAFVRQQLEQLHVTGDMRFLHELADAAKELFISAKKKNRKSGEPGEVVLFSLLEGLLDAPRIVSKMRLKTNRNMEVYGSDAIHMKYEPESETLVLYWGESKLYQELANALGEIADSISKFHTENSADGSNQHDFDINIIQANPDIDTPQSDATREALLTFFNPYAKYSNRRKEVHACLALWDWDFYTKVASMEPEKAEEAFVAQYLERIKSACSLFIDKVKKHGIEDYRFHFFLLPMHDVQSFRKRFCEMVGLPFDDVGGSNNG